MTSTATWKESPIIGLCIYTVGVVSYLFLYTNYKYSIDGLAVGSRIDRSIERPACELVIQISDRINIGIGRNISKNKHMGVTLPANF